MKRSSVYWLASSLSQTHEHRAAILDEIGYQVYFFENFDMLVREVMTRRAQIIILGDEWPGEEALSYAHAFAHIPDINAARLLLSNSKNHFELMELAAGEGFRDIIPFDLDDAEWLQRFEFATSGLSSILSHHENLPEIQLSLSIEIPTRLVWVGAQQMWMETRVFPKIGASLSLTGEFVRAMGLAKLQVQVQQQQQTSLTYRFSEALICHWYQDAVLNAEAARILQVLDQLAEDNLGVRPKIFLAIQSPALRTTLLKYLDPKRYEVHTALHRSSLIYEPKYFSPDLVFIEDRLLQGDAKRGFYELLRFLPEHASLISIGGKDERPLVKGNNTGRKIKNLKHVPVNLLDLMEKELLPHPTSPKENDETQAYYLPVDHPLSYGHIQLEAELVAMDELQINFLSQAKIGSFSLIRLNHPELKPRFGEQIFAKVIATEELKEGTFLCKAQLCNLIHR